MILMALTADQTVEALRAAVAHVARAARDGLVGQLEAFEHGLGVPRERVERRDAVLGPGEPHQLHLVELVHADDPARVATGRAGLAAEAGREREVPDGELRLVEDLVTVQVRHRHLGGRDEVGGLAGELRRQPEEIFLELRQLTGPGHALGGHHVGDEHLAVAALFRHVREEGHERAFHAREGVGEHVEAAAGELRRALRVVHAERGGDLVVRAPPGAGVAPLAYDDVSVLVGAARGVGVHLVRQPQEETRFFLLECRDLSVERRGAVARQLDLALESLGLNAAPLLQERADLGGQLVSTRQVLVALGLRRASLGDEIHEAVHHPEQFFARVAAAQALSDGIGVLGNQVRVDHGGRRLIRNHSAGRARGHVLVASRAKS